MYLRRYMITAQPCTKIDFRPITIEDKALYDRFLTDGTSRGCEASFANMFLWGERQIAAVDGHILIISLYGGRYA